MRLTASRQSPNDVSRPENSGHPKATPDPQNDSFPQPPCGCKPISADTEKCGRAGPRDTPYGGAPQAPRKPVYSNPLSEPPTLHERTCKIHPSLNTTINTPSLQVSPHTYTHQTLRTCRLRRSESGMRPRDGWGPNVRPLPLGAPNIPERPQPPSKLTIHCEGTYIHLLSNCATSKPPHTISSLADTKRPTGTTH